MVQVKDDRGHEEEEGRAKKYLGIRTPGLGFLTTMTASLVTV